MLSLSFPHKEQEDRDMPSFSNSKDTFTAGRQQRVVIVTGSPDDEACVTVTDDDNDDDITTSTRYPGLTDEADEIIRRRVTQNVRAGWNAITSAQDQHITIINHGDD